MNSCIRTFAYCATALVILSAVAPACAGTWDLAADFSVAANPNGAWSYGSEPSLDGPLLLYSDAGDVPAHYGTTQLAGWNTPVWGPPPFVLKNVSKESWYYDGRPVRGGVGVLGPGQVLMHPLSSANRMSVARWTAPASGTFLVSASFHRFEEVEGPNSTWAIVDNGIPVPGGKGVLVGFSGTQSGATYASPALVLHGGDAIDFAVATAPTAPPTGTERSSAR